MKNMKFYLNETSVNIVVNGFHIRPDNEETSLTDLM